MIILNNIVIPFLENTYNQTAILIIVVLLIVYIGYLHYLLSRKTSKIKEIENLINNKTQTVLTDSRPKTFKHDGKYSKGERSEIRDKLLNENIKKFLFENEKGRKIFIHYTKDKENAWKIIREGFKFVDSFYKTAEEVRNDNTDLLYKHNRRKSYGDYIIVISIDKDIYNYYMKEAEKVPSYEIVVEQLLTEKPPYLNDDSEMIYTFHHKFIKGFINYPEGKIYENPDFNPTYNSYQFYENLKKLAYGE